MVGGVLVVLTAALIDQIGKLVFDLIVVALFVYLAWQLRSRGRLRG